MSLSSESHGLVSVQIIRVVQNNLEGTCCKDFVDIKPAIVIIVVINSIVGEISIVIQGLFSVLLSEVEQSISSHQAQPSPSTSESVQSDR